MQLLEERIRKDGIVKPGNILKVDSFLNTYNRGFRDWNRLSCCTAFQCSGCFCKKSTKLKLRWRNVLHKSTVFYS